MVNFEQFVLLWTLEDLPKKGKKKEMLNQK